MTQATDGNWYAYFADSDNAVAADSLATTAGTSLDFGKGCTAAGSAALGPAFTGDLSETVGFYHKNNPAADADVPAAPAYPILLCAYAKAIAERGDDTSTIYQIAQRDYEKALSDAVALDITHQYGKLDWVVV